MSSSTNGLRLTVCLMAVAILLAALAPAASAGPLPEPTGDYESEALDLCEDGDIDCVRETLDAMLQHTRMLAMDCDHDAAFAALYSVVTTFYYHTVLDDPDFFSDTSFVNHEDVVFAYYYFWPYVNWHNGLREAVPPAWKEAFDAADNQEVTAAGNLLLGINAHVVRDLPFVLAGLGLGDKADHDRVNAILYEAYEPAIRAIDAHLADSVDDGDVPGTRLDNDALFQIVVSWREQAWHDATRLADASTPLERAAIAAEIEEKAHAQAVTYRDTFAYPPGTDAREDRNAFCAENAWPPDWLGGS